jgi:hypothetical protein
VDNILWDASRGSAPHGIDAPCITIEEAKRMGLLPIGAALPPNTQACIAYNMVNGHPVVAVTYTPGHPTPPEPPTIQFPAGANGWNLNGTPNYDPIAFSWLSQQIIDEISAGFVGAMLDCFDDHAPEEQEALMNALPGSAGKSFYDYLKILVCDLLGYLFNPECDTDDPSTRDALEAALVLAEFCQHSLLDEVMRKQTSCEPTPEPPEPPEPPTPEEETTPPGPTGTCCVCHSWPGKVICPICSWSNNCACLIECIPIPPGYGYGY